MPASVITLTTDFGVTDTFVGTMKGVILSINPQAAIVDITHDVPPQDILAGAFAFESARSYFPPGAIHMLVVDPGVGTARRPLLVVGPNAYFVCPDNGVLTYCYTQAGFPVPDGSKTTAGPIALPSGWRAYHLTKPQFWRHPVSNTFHGRDIFAPVAAYLSRGVPPESMGPLVNTVMTLPLPKPREIAGKLVGVVLHIDRFGNLVTNITAEALAHLNGRILVEVRGKEVHGLSGSYQEGKPLAALIGSHGYLEIAAANSSAAHLLGLATGATVSVTKS